ncbi:MAG: hypothetical protein GY898_01955 [Proteobacteria bacterium]|nr:hypothetical protein [Pseudomonadota bacterium]
MRTLMLMLMLMTGLLLVPTSGFAQGADEEEDEPKRATTDRTLLVWGPSSLKDDGSTARATLESHLDAEAPFPSRTLRISDWLGAARFRLGGSALAVPCATPPAEEELPEDAEDEIDGLLQLGRKVLDDFDAPRALELFQLADARIPCQTTFLSQDTLYRTYFYAGIAAHFAQQTKASASWFRQAAAVDADRDWDPSFGPEPQSTFLSSVQDVVARPKGRTFGDMRATNYVEVRLDGEPLDLTKPFEGRVHPGVHLIQAVDDKGRWSTFVRQIDEGATLTFFSAAGAESLVLDGPDGVLKGLAAGTLTKRAEEERLTEIYIVALDTNAAAPPRVYGYTPDIKQWARLEKSSTGEIKTTTETAEVTTVEDAETEMTPEERTRHAFLRDPDYRSSATFGFKFSQWSLCSAADTTRSGDGTTRCPDGREQIKNYLGGIIGIDIRLVQGLNLDLRFGAQTTDFKVGGNVLPEFGAGFRYRFLQGVIQPFVAIAGQMFFSTFRPSEFEGDSVRVYGGLVGYGGVDFEFPDGFRLGIDAGGGAILVGEPDQEAFPVGQATISIGRFMP